MSVVGHGSSALCVCVAFSVGVAYGKQWVHICRDVKRVGTHVFARSVEHARAGVVAPSVRKWVDTHYEVRRFLTLTLTLLRALRRALRCLN
jgi:hypothetical protein